MMTEGIEKVLYFDPQLAAFVCCSRCGGARYAPGYGCIRCQRDGHDT